MPKVSIIIPVYNVEKYVYQSVTSILNQTLSDIEIIIINDGSTDASFSIVKQLANQDNRIKLITTRNNGISIARNIGIHYATGEYIYFFDSDDVLDEKTLELCYNKCLLNNLDFIFFDATAFSEDNNSINEYNFHRSDKYKDIIYNGIDLLEIQLNTGGYSSPVWLNMIKRQYIDSKCLFFYPQIIHEDILFTFFLYLKAERVGFYNASFLHYRVRNNSIKTAIFGMNNVNGYLTAARIMKLYYQQCFVSKREKILLKRYINYIINFINCNIVKISPEKRSCIQKILVNEFGSYLSWKLLIIVKYPKIYRFIKRLR